MTSTFDSKANETNYLGGEGDPQPVFRKDAPAAFAWPEGAAFAVVFKREDYGKYFWKDNYGDSAERIEFFGADGWPLELPAKRKTLSDIMKREFQVFPRNWKTWQDDMWRSAEDRPETFPRLRAQAGIARPLANMTAKLADPTQG